MFFQRIPILVSVALLALILGAPRDARAFCGFYVGKADGALVNHASQVVIAHHDDKTVISLMNDYQGEPSEFALVVPVPVVLQKGQVHIGDRDLFQKIDAYSSPRLVEYFDSDPCELMRPMAMAGMALHRMESAAPVNQVEAKSARRHGRGGIHRRRVRHRDSVGQGIVGAGNLAAAKRLQNSARSESRARALHSQRHEVLRRKGQSHRAEAHRLDLSAAAAVRVRIAEVHAADSARDD